MKRICFLIMLVGLFILPSFSFADDIDNKKTVKIENFEVTVPEKDNTFTTDGEIVVTGVGQKHAIVDIQAYSVKTTMKDKEKVVKLLFDSYEAEIDSLKVFAHNVKLKAGENHIVITLTRNDKKYTFTKIVHYDKDFNILRAVDYKMSVK